MITFWNLNLLLKLALKDFQAVPISQSIPFLAVRYWSFVFFPPVLYSYIYLNEKQNKYGAVNHGKTLPINKFKTLTEIIQGCDFLEQSLFADAESILAN